jgi:zinc/manganese transport system substrate-binding protein
MGLLCACLAALAGCGNSTTPHGQLRVVAAENFWGSVAAAQAGRGASVQSIISNPAVDPHSYQATTSDARALAMAQLVVVNGLGYDPWVQRLLDANPVPGRIVVNVGQLLGLKVGDNPHRWYDPVDVDRVAAAIGADLRRLQPGTRFPPIQTFVPYRRLIAAIRARYQGVPVGASESIFAPMAAALGLRLLTPTSFMDAIAEGTDVSARDVLTTQEQITSAQIKVWVYNSQNTTPAIRQLNALARARHIPVVTITESTTGSFARWQMAQLIRLRAALHEATGR